MSVPNRANHPNRKVELSTKEMQSPSSSQVKKPKLGHENPKPPVKSTSYGGNPIGPHDLNIVRSGSSGAFKQMGFKTPIERAKNRERRASQPPLPGF